MKRYIVQRLKEPSTHAGIAGIAQGMALIAPSWKPALDALTLMFGLIATAVPG